MCFKGTVHLHTLNPDVAFIDDRNAVWFLSRCTSLKRVGWPLHIASGKVNKQKLMDSNANRTSNDVCLLSTCMWYKTDFLLSGLVCLLYYSQVELLSICTMNKEFNLIFLCIFYAQRSDL